MECKFCKIEMTRKDFSTCYFLWCCECFHFERFDIECKHQIVPAVLICSNSAKQLRDYCRKCRKLIGSPKSQTGVNIEGIKSMTYDDFNALCENQEKPERDAIIHFIDELHKKKDEDMKFDYKQYLNSDEWKAIRRNIMLRDGSKCQICGSDERLDVHHLTYAHFKNEYPFELVILCRDCHHEEYHSTKAAAVIESVEVEDIKFSSA